VGSLRTKAPRHPKKKLAITVFSSRPTRGNLGTRLTRWSSLDPTGCSRKMKRLGHDVQQNLPRIQALMEADQLIPRPQGAPGTVRIAHRHERGGVRSGSPPIRSGWRELGQPPGNAQQRCTTWLIYGGHFRQIFLWACSPPSATKAIPIALLLFAQCQPPTTALGRVLHLPGEVLGRPMRCCISHPRLAGVRCRQKQNGLSGNLLPGS